MWNLLFFPSLGLFPMTYIIKITCLLDGQTHWCVQLIFVIIYPSLFNMKCTYIMLTYIDSQSLLNSEEALPWAYPWDVISMLAVQERLRILSPGNQVLTELWLRRIWFLEWITFENRESLNQYKITPLYLLVLDSISVFFNCLVFYNRHLVSYL